MNGCDDQVADEDTVRPEGGAMGEDEFQVDTEGEPGERKTKKLQEPKMPTRTEIEEHNLTHLPYRSWCRHCVRGRGRSYRTSVSGSRERCQNSMWTCASWARRRIRTTRSR